MSESDVCRHQILMYKDDPRAGRVNKFNTNVGWSLRVLLHT